MENVVIAAACRTPIGLLGGQFKTLTALDLTIPVMQNLVGRVGTDPSVIDDVIWGCNYQKTYKENNLARVAAVKAGLPVTVPGITLHRNCTSSMSAIQMGYYQIKAGEADCIMCGGAESMSTAPHVVYGARFGKKLGEFEMRDSMWDSLTNLGIGPEMIMTAENVADKYTVTREEMDAWSLRSHRRACAAIDSGKFKDEIIPITVHGRMDDAVYDTDEGPRRDSSIKALSDLKPALPQATRVTAGNSSTMNDAASGVIIMSEVKADSLGIKSLARIISTATTGVEPDIMGIGPIDSSKKALSKASLTIDDMDRIEINEAFASQCIACTRELGIDENKINVNGSGVSLGHPVGASGCRLVVTLIYELLHCGGRYGLASLCAGGGMGTAIVIEKL